MRKLLAAIFIIIISVLIYFAQEERIRNYYYEYTNKIGYKDLIIGSSSDVIDKYCQKLPDSMSSWSSFVTNICYNDPGWTYKFTIQNDKIESYRMISFVEEGDNASDEEKFRYTLLTVQPIINKLHKRYVLDGDPETTEGLFGKNVTTWSFGNDSVTVRLQESEFANTLMLVYQNEYSSNF